MRCKELVLLVSAVITGQVNAAISEGLVPDDSKFASTYSSHQDKAIAITNANVLTGTDEQLSGATVLFKNGKIVAIGNTVRIPDGTEVIDGAGRWVTPGIVDPHSHIGIFSAPRVPANMDLNEKTSPNTADKWVEHSVWPQAPGFERAREAGVTTMMILPGSANLYGGRTVTLKNVEATNIQDMKFPQAPYGLKMACGENPLKVYGGKGESPMTRMGLVADFRSAWLKAVEYKDTWDAYYSDKEAGKDVSPPERNLRLETMAGALRGDILTHLHCYRVDEVTELVNMSKEFGFHIDVLHHGSEGYKMTKLLKDENIAVSTWSNRWGFKLEMFDGIEENAAMLEHTGVLTSLHSDAAELSQRMNVEAAIAMSASLRAGIPISKAEAISWITANPAKQIGIFDKTGSLEKGKMADIVLWSGDPFSIYTKPDSVFIDGVEVYNRSHPADKPASDFELGNKK